MPRTLEIVTPEHVAIRYELAGVGSRAVAAALDLLLQLLVIGLFGGAIALFLSLSGSAGLGDLIDRWSQPVIIGLSILALFAVLWGYHVLFETWWSGETPGKRVMGLRVIRDGGYPVDFRAVAIRNLVRTVDLFPYYPLFGAVPLVTYGLAFVAVLSHPHNKRLGDMAAGTLVVRHRREKKADRLGFGEAVVFRLIDGAIIYRLAHVTRDEHRMVQHFLERRYHLTPELRLQFAHRLAEPLMARVGYTAPVSGVDDERWLEEIDLAYRQRSLGAPTVAAPAPAAIPVTRHEVAVTAPLDGRKW